MAPVQYEVSDGVLKVRRQAAHALEGAAAVTGAARAALLEQGSSLIEELRASNNFDRRLLQTLERLQARLDSNENVVGLAIDNMTFGQLVSSMADQLPDALSGLLAGFAVGITGYVGQFEEWQTFADNAASVEYEAADVQQMRDIGRTLLTELPEADLQVDPEVRDSLQIILGSLGVSGRSLRRAGLAAYRTIENLVSAVFKGFIEGIQEGSKQGTTKVVKWVIVTAACHAAWNMSDIASRTGLPDWMKAAAEQIQKHYPPKD